MDNPFREIIDRLIRLEAKVDHVEMKLPQHNIAPPTHQGEDWLSVEDLMKYDPAKPAKQTVYSWVHYKLIPYHKRGRRVFFKRADVDLWLASDRKQTAAEIDREVDKRIAASKITKAVPKKRPVSNPKVKPLKKAQ